MKKGFTMIELIFVIVILGILAAVAVPKLAATRDDARLVSIKTDIATAISAVPAWYQGQKDVRIAQAMQLDTVTWVPNATAGTQEYTWKDGTTDCARLAVYDMNESNGVYSSNGVAVAADFNSTNGYWTGTGVPVFRVMKVPAAPTGNCATLWNSLGVVEANVSMAGRKVTW